MAASGGKADSWATPTDEEAREGLDEQAAAWVTGANVTAVRDAALKDALAKPGPAGAELLDKCLFVRRWLVAREGDVEEATKMLLRHMQWRQEECPWFPDLPPTDRIAEDLSRGKVMRHGTTIAGKPCLYVFADKHSVYDTTQERTQELVIYSIEQTMRTLGRTGGAVVIFDFKDAPWSAMDTDAAKYVVRMLSLNYPESLDRILIVNYGMLFSALWTVISPFLSARTTAKVKFVTEAQLTELIAPDQLPLRLGGTADVEPDEKGDSRPVSATP